ncbi:MAG: LPS-assembly lipoprotein LptE [Rhodanobacter sp.]
MNVAKVGRLCRASLLLGSVFLLGACSFHLRQSEALPTSLQRMHVVVSDGDFSRSLTRALAHSGITVEDTGGPGIAELRIATAAFSTDRLTAGGYSKITEYSVHYLVQFDATDAAGKLVLPLQTINMSREYSYDATNSVGNASQVQEIQRSLNDDMVQSILFRLQAEARRELGAPAAAASTR